MLMDISIELIQFSPHYNLICKAFLLKSSLNHYSIGNYCFGLFNIFKIPQIKFKCDDWSFIWLLTCFIIIR
jgi:hypothetical protein